ncbi:MULTISPECIES: methionyl-tRNA formyltransferase [Alicyclobacillus]|uniref:methionyl-tRNA formyltransferase n=1 Tax=Alicyclobacillus TaxID=29330 RepID=UPI001FE02C22|nr:MULTISPECIES: methionyl-tRNA formyltransferase [Alicyclobacillus]
MARIVFLGTPPFAVPSLEALVRVGHEVCLVVTQPDRPVGRKRMLTAPAVKQAALALGLEVAQPERVRTDEIIERVRTLAPDVLITAAYGQILPERLLQTAGAGCLNVHASLLPRWRGAAPLQRALMAGDEQTGVTLMEMVKQLDAGPMLARAETRIGSNDNLGELEARVAQMGAELLVEVLPRYLAGQVTPVPQPPEGVTYAERITRKDEAIDWAQPGWQVHNHIRALSPAPGASCSWQGQPFKVWESHWPMRPCSPVDGVPGDVRFLGGEVCVRTGDGWLPVTKVQPAGKRAMEAAAWLRGVTSRAAHLAAGSR